MFGNDKAKPQPQVPTIDSFLGEDISIEGKIQTKGSLRLDGKIYGDLSIDNTLVIGEKGFVSGNIKGGEVEIYGHVVGNIVAKELIVLAKTGLIEGDLEMPRLTIEEGGRLNGKSSMVGEKPSKNFEEPQKKQDNKPKL